MVDCRTTGKVRDSGTPLKSLNLLDTSFIEASLDSHVRTWLQAIFSSASSRSIGYTVNKWLEVRQSAEYSSVWTRSICRRYEGLVILSSGVEL